MRPFGEVVASPFEVSHTVDGLRELVRFIKGLDGETKAVVECTGSYHLPIARALCDAGLHVSAVNPQLIHDYGGRPAAFLAGDGTGVRTCHYYCDA